MNKRALKFAIPLAVIAAQGFDEPADAGDLFIKYDGIDGESTDQYHKDWVDVLAWSWGMTADYVAGGGGSSKALLSPIKIIKSFDAASNELILNAALGRAMGRVTMEATRPLNAEEDFTYMTLTLDNVFITKVAVGGKDTENGVAETISMEFEQIKVEYKTLNSKGVPTTVNEFCFDVRTNTKC